MFNIIRWWVKRLSLSSKREDVLSVTHLFIFFSSDSWHRIYSTEFKVSPYKEFYETTLLQTNFFYFNYSSRFWSFKSLTTSQWTFIQMAYSQRKNCSFRRAPFVRRPVLFCFPSSCVSLKQDVWFVKKWKCIALIKTVAVCSKCTLGLPCAQSAHWDCFRVNFSYLCSWEGG